jgi:hypothetical protein
MQRRLLLSIPVAAALAGAALAPRSARAQPRFTVSAAQLQQAVAKRFPLRYAVRGLFELTVREPELRLLPELNRVATSMLVAVEGPALQRGASGEFDIDFGLRYEASDQSIRARGLRVRSLRVPDLPPPYPGLLDTLRDALAQQAFGEIVLHRLKLQDLGLAGSLGLEPDTITVVPEGLVITFAPRRTL